MYRNGYNQQKYGGIDGMSRDYYFPNEHIDTAKIKECAKADAGKPNLSLVPTSIIYEIEKVRDFGVKKYKNPDNWKDVEMERYPKLY